MSDKKKKRTSSRKASKRRILYFTEKFFYVLVTSFLIEQAVSILLIWKTGMSLDTFITETNTTFRVVGGACIAKFLTENIFKKNKLSFSEPLSTYEETNNEDISQLDESAADDSGGTN